MSDGNRNYKEKLVAASNIVNPSRNVNYSY
uniref:Uncharacterized protein n=1 Tax=Arundo donax TaxID=35708 RepID=A0A0A9BR23_ARUDO